MRGLTWLCSIVLLAIFGCRAGECADDEGAGGTLTGRVFLPKQSSAIPSTRVLLTADSGVQSSAFLLPDGAFTISGLPSGSYRLDVACMGFMFPQYRVDVSSGTVQVQNLSGAKLPDDNRVFLPLGSANYYQQRKPFDLKGMLMSPYGLMGMLAVFALVVFPMMKVDPEEYKQMQNDMKDSPFAGMLGINGGGDAGGQAKAITSGQTSKKKRT